MFALNGGMVIDPDPLRQLRASVLRPGRTDEESATRLHFRFGFVALVPVLLLLLPLVTSGFPPRAAPVDGPEPPAALAAVEADRTLALSRLEDYPMGEWPASPSGRLARATALRDSLAGPVAARTASEERKRLREQEAWRAAYLFGAAILIFLSGAVAALKAQIDLGRRHVDHLLAARSDRSAGPVPSIAHVAAGRLTWQRAFWAFVLLFSICLAVATVFRLPWIPDGEQFPLARALVFSALGALTLLNIFVAASAVRIYALNFPTSQQVAKALEPITSKLQAMARDPAYPGGLGPRAVQLGGHAETQDVVAELIDAWNYLPADERDETSPMISATLPAKGALAVVRLIMTLLAAVLVAALVVVHLASNLVVAEHALSKPMSESLMSYGQTALIVLGLGFSLAYAAIYLPAFVRLDPFASASESGDADIPSDPAPSTPNPQLAIAAAIRELAGVQAAAASGQGGTPKPPRPPIQMCDYLGMSERKLYEVVAGASWGGGLHQVAQDTALKKLMEVAKGSAPLAASAVLVLA